jgi:hypothetical protein
VISYQHAKPTKEKMQDAICMLLEKSHLQDLFLLLLLLQL